jgi:hypothetical protein
VAQRRLAKTLSAASPVVQAKAAAPRGALPEGLRRGAEALSGIALGDVRVHYNSAEPAKLGALAHAQGGDIHLGPGQERHLPHEAWHVVQQRQGRVRPTTQLKAGVAINDDAGLEREADVMGARALQAASSAGSAPASAKTGQAPIVQRKISYAYGYSSEEDLLGALYKLFDKKAHKLIAARVTEWEKLGGRAVFASTVFKDVVEYAKSQGFSPTFAVTTSVTSSLHGPQLPTRVNRTAEDNHEDALSTFNFPSVTLARAVLSNGKTVVNFHDRQVDSNFHAEDGIIEQLEEYIKAHRVNTVAWKFNLTLNNFFCAKNTTGKSNKGDNCLQEIIDLHKKNRFARFHVYFMNPYGDREKMLGNIRRLQAAGILVTAFSTDEDTPAYTSPELDPESESESEEEPPRRSSKKRERESPPPKRRTDGGKTGGEKEERSTSKRSASSSKRSAGGDVVTYRGHRFSTNVQGVRDLGQCFWDTLRQYGVHHSRLRAAAAQVGLNLDQHVDAQALAPFIQELNRRGESIALRLVTFDIFTLQQLDSVRIGDGGTVLYIGLFLDADQGEGHYVPELD